MARRRVTVDRGGRARSGPGRRAVMMAVGVTVSGLLFVGSAAGTTPRHPTIGARPVMSRAGLARALVALRSTSEQVADSVLVWGCVQATEGPAASGEVGSVATSHAIAMCRPVPPTDSAFPTVLANPGPEQFGPEIAALERFARSSSAVGGPVAFGRAVEALRRASAGLAAELTRGGPDPRWASGVRTALIRVDGLLERVQAQLGRTG